MLHLVINNTDKLYTNNIFRGLFRTMSNRIRPSVTLFCSRPGEAIGRHDIFARSEKIKKYSVRFMHAHASKYCWFRWFRVPGGCSSTRLAAVMNTRRSLMRFSRERRDSVCAARDLRWSYTWPGSFSKREKEKKEEKPRNRWFKKAAPENRRCSSVTSRSISDGSLHIVVSTRRKTGISQREPIICRLNEPTMIRERSI